jgi:hypothetical protein
MDRRQEQVNEAAEKFADAIRESYRAVADRTVSAQERSVELTQRFFDGVISNLRIQAENNLEATRQLADQQRRAQEATQALTQESVGAYVDFLNSMFSFYRGSVEAVERSTEEAEGSTGATPEGRADGSLPLEDYESLNVNAISERLDGLSVEEVERLRDYEVRNKNRRTLMRRLNARIEADSS